MVNTKLILLTLVVAAATGGCQKRPSNVSKPARAFLDSAIAANEALYDSTTSGLGLNRLLCLGSRAQAKFGDDLTYDLLNRADSTVELRHTKTEWLAGKRGQRINHPADDDELCLQIDSLWSVFLATRARVRP